MTLTVNSTSDLNDSCFIVHITQVENGVDIFSGFIGKMKDRAVWEKEPDREKAYWFTNDNGDFDELLESAAAIPTVDVFLQKLNPIIYYDIIEMELI